MGRVYRLQNKGRVVMQRVILLLNDKEESERASKLLKESGVSFFPCPADDIWYEIDWPIPTVFCGDKNYKGLDEIEKAIGEISSVNAS